MYIYIYIYMCISMLWATQPNLVDSIVHRDDYWLLFSLFGPLGFGIFYYPFVLRGGGGGERLADSMEISKVVEFLRSGLTQLATASCQEMCQSKAAVCVQKAWQSALIQNNSVFIFLLGRCLCVAYNIVSMHG